MLTGTNLPTKLTVCLCLVMSVNLVGTMVVWGSDPTETQKAENAFFRGSHLLSRDNMTEALPALEEAVSLDPENVKFKRVLAIAYNNYGIRLSKEGKTLQGLRFFEKALGVQPEDTEIRTNFFNACLQAVSVSDDRVNEKDKIYFLKKALEINPKDTVAKKALAALLNNASIVKGSTLLGRMR